MGLKICSVMTIKRMECQQLEDDEQLFNKADRVMYVFLEPVLTGGSHFVFQLIIFSRQTCFICMVRFHMDKYGTLGSKYDHPYTTEMTGN
jgi:hypothetical protein